MITLHSVLLHQAIGDVRLLRGGACVVGAVDVIGGGGGVRLLEQDVLGRRQRRLPPRTWPLLPQRRVERDLESAIAAVGLGSAHKPRRKLISLDRRRGAPS